MYTCPSVLLYVQKHSQRREFAHQTPIRLPRSKNAPLIAPQSPNTHMPSPSLWNKATKDGHVTAITTRAVNWTQILHPNEGHWCCNGHVRPCSRRRELHSFNSDTVLYPHYGLRLYIDHYFTALQTHWIATMTILAIFAACLGALPYLDQAANELKYTNRMLPYIVINTISQIV
jgi:hypothetical protein